MSVFALGSNGSGQLGIGHSEDVSVPKPVVFYQESPADTHAIVGGGNHTLLLTKCGRLYWSGDASSGACGPPPAQDATGVAVNCFHRMVLDDRDEPTATFRPVTMAAATWQASIFVRSDGDGRSTSVYTCGTGTKGELGQGPMIVRLSRPSLLEDFPPEGTEVVHLAACIGHIVVVLSDGTAYGWGNGRKGQLGEPATVTFSPRMIAGVGFAVQHVAAGRDFTCLLGRPDEGKYTILGADKWGITSSVGGAPALLPPWKEVVASWSNLYVLRVDGTLMSWGRNDYGQNNAAVVSRIRKLAVGSEHVVALLDNDDVAAWGWGEHGNCGPVTADGRQGHRNTIVAVGNLPPGIRVVAVGAGCATTWVIIGRNSNTPNSPPRDIRPN
jgi:protein ATS1